MKRLLSKLFASRTRAIRKTARPARRPGLAIETLDQRVLPSATHTLVNGVLTLTADDNGAQVFILGSSGNLGISGADISTITSPVNQIVFKGGKGNDTFTDFSSIDSRVIGSAGSDQYFGGGSTNLLDRNGFNVVWQGSTGGTNIVYGLGNGKPTTDDLNASGAMMVSLSADLSTLTFAGPSGIGFRMQANNGFWFDLPLHDNSGNTFHKFSPSPGASLTLVTGSILGNISLPSSQLSSLLSVQTKAEPWSDPVGEYNGMAIGPTISLDTTLFNPPTPLNQLEQQYGFDFKLPGLNFGLDLGSALAANGGPMSGAPLDSAVPYFYIANSAQASVEIGGYSGQVGTKVSVAFDPSDPFLYAAVQGIPTPEGPIDIALGASVNGHILFHPQLAPPSSILGISVPPPNIAGNVYIGGIIPLPDTPLAITGSMVIGLAQNGRALGSQLTSARVDAFLHGQQTLQDLASMASPPSIGINGELDIGKDFAAGTGIVQMKLGTAVAYYTPTPSFPNFQDIVGNKAAVPPFNVSHAFILYAQSANPWDGIKIPGNVTQTLGQVINAITDAREFTLEGIVDSQRNWAVQIDASATGLFGFNTTGSLHFEATSLTKQVEFAAGIQAPFGLGGARLTGFFDLQTGNITLSESVGVSFNIPFSITVGSLTIPIPFSVNAQGSETLTLSANLSNLRGSAVLDVSATGGFSSGTASASGHGAVTVDASHNASVSGSGEFDVNGTKLGSVSFDNGGITILGTHFNWPSDGALIADGPALVGNPALLHFFVPDGIAEPLHFSAALSHDGLAADYNSASTDPNVSFTFAAPGSYTVYGRMYHADGQVEDYQATLTVYGMDQSSTYFVEKLYHDLLGRASDPTGLGYYTGELAKGITHAQVAASFLHSMEYEQDVVHAAYHDFLGRYAEPMGLQGWVSYLQAGHTVTDLRMQIITSPEYTQSHSDDSAFVQSLYQNVLGRTGSQAEVDYYTQVLASVASRADVVQSFFGSPEYRNKLTEDTYQQFLHRDADSAGLWMYTQSLSKGGTDLMVMDSVLSSPEYAPLN
ncbi:MAG TPA: DUF4214 domain-containing protein [Gemmataceae bacterium]|nr:DUF4214 domain-containing protein [Gemmataceae bacterium]